MLIAQTILNHLQIASPCSADWASMSGDERCRHCAQCDKRVYDISALRADEALALIREAEGHLCVRLWRRADGTVLTADCPLGRRVRQRRILRMAVGAPAMLALALVNTACAKPQTMASVSRQESLAHCSAPATAPARFGMEDGIPTATVEVVASAPRLDTGTLMGMMTPGLNPDLGGPLSGPTQGRSYGRFEMEHLPIR